MKYTEHIRDLNDLRVSLNSSSNLLEKDPYRYQLQDVPEPQLFRQMFPYDEIPKVSFNFRRVPMDMPKEIWITDTSFRDGMQSRAPYTVKQICDLYTMLHKLGGEKGIIRQTEFFVYSENDRNALYKCMEMGYKFPEITTWIRASKNDFKLVRDIGIKETGILVSCSDYHIFKKLGLTRKLAMDKYLGVVKDAIEAGLRPRCHFEDITRADFYGFVVPFANALTALSEESGIPIKIRACDTMGYGIPFTGASLPRSVPGIIYGLRHLSGIPSEMIEWHGHNDFYKGVTNASTAWLFGASSVNASMLGIGERTGNIPLEAMVFEYASLRGTTDGMDTTVITDIARYFEKEMGYHIPEMTPFVGRHFNSTRAGIHADGLMKDEEIYNIFNTEKILNRPVDVIVSGTSGLAGIAYWVNNHYTLPENEKVNKQSEVVLEMKKFVDSEYEKGRQTQISDDELEAIAEKFGYKK